MQSKNLSTAQLSAIIEKTHPGLGGKFTAAQLLKGVFPRDPQARVETKVQKNLLSQLNVRKKILWTTPTPGKPHYGYGRDNLRYVLQPKNGRGKYQVVKELPETDTAAPRAYTISFWDLITPGQTPPGMKELFTVYEYDLSAAQKLCARDYAVMLNPQKLSWVLPQDEAVFYASGVGMKQYLLLECGYREILSEDLAAGRIFRAEVSGSTRTGGKITVLSEGGFTLNNAMGLAQKDHGQALLRSQARKASRSRR